MTSVLAEQAWREEITRAQARANLQLVSQSPIKPALPRGLAAEAMAIAEAFGWAKTYDAEYVATARLLDARLVTVDGKLWRGTRRLGSLVIDLEELFAED